MLLSFSYCLVYSISICNKAFALSSYNCCFWRNCTCFSAITLGETSPIGWALGGTTLYLLSVRFPNGVTTWGTLCLRLPAYICNSYFAWTYRTYSWWMDSLANFTSSRDLNFCFCCLISFSRSDCWWLLTLLDEETYCFALIKNWSIRCCSFS